MTKKSLLNVFEYCLITFPTTHSAMHAEKVLDERNMTQIIVPTPREISEGCGLAVRCHCEDLAEIINVLSGSGIEIKEYYQVEKGPEKNLVICNATQPKIES